jgi:FtsP/CotA-like multicopper oxidase with cupredoxin domain
VPAQHGLLGPVLRADVGQGLEVVFSNRLPFAVNLDIDGGAVRLAGSDSMRAPVPPNGTATYRLRIPDR